MNSTERFFVEITSENGKYRGIRHKDNPAFGWPLKDLQLGPEANVIIKEKSYRLGDLVQALLNFQNEDLQIAYDERGQLEIGHFLYHEIFGKLCPHELKKQQECQVDLRIVTTDEHIARLPWVLLAHQGLFLSATGWSIALARTCQVHDCQLPENPKMLILAPEPVGLPETRAESHLETMEYRLSCFQYRLSWGDHLQKASTWEEFQTQLQEFKPDIVYYYGHGIGDRHQSRLVFASGAGRKPLEKPIADFAQCLRTLDNPPKLVYLNCCSGDAGGFLGAGWQLGEFIPAVVANRTVAHIDAAQSQGLAFWSSVLSDGSAPHIALAQIRARLGDLNLSFRDARWLTPVLHCHYADWKYAPPKRVDPLEHDPHWHLKLDRVQQFSPVAFQTRQMLRERKPRSLAYIWYGPEGQGVDIFHERLQVELQKDLPGHGYLLKIDPAWPLHLYDQDQAFKEMLTRAFQANSFEDIPRCIRAQIRGETGRQVLVYVCHQPVLSKKIFNPRILKYYLSWWDRHFIPLLKDHSYGLLTVSFVVDNPAKFRQAVLEDVRLYDLELSGTVYRLLDELERVGMKDLLDFIQTHNVKLPRWRKESLLQRILEKTEGHYELTISELKKLVQRAWDEVEAEKPKPTETKEEFDY